MPNIRRRRNTIWIILWSVIFVIVVGLAIAISNDPSESPADRADRVCKENHPYNISDQTECKYRLLIRYVDQRERNSIRQDEKDFN